MVAEWSVASGHQDASSLLVPEEGLLIWTPAEGYAADGGQAAAKRQVFVSASDYEQLGTPGKAVLAMSFETGRVLWRRNIPNGFAQFEGYLSAEGAALGLRGDMLYLEHIKHVNRAADESPTELRLSLDAKAQVKVGPFSRGGYSWVAVKAADHDFEPEAQLVPIGILVPALGELSVYVADQRATADALVDALDRYWTDNASRFPLVETLVLNLDNGPENHSRRTQFVARLVEFADSHRVNVRLAYYPPYHSKYNSSAPTPPPLATGPTVCEHALIGFCSRR